MGGALTISGSAPWVVGPAYFLNVIRSQPSDLSASAGVIADDPISFVALRQTAWCCTHTAAAGRTTLLLSSSSAFRRCLRCQSAQRDPPLQLGAVAGGQQGCKALSMPSPGSSSRFPLHPLPPPAPLKRQRQHHLPQLPPQHSSRRGSRRRGRRQSSHSGTSSGSCNCSWRRRWTPKS